ncbi:MAG: phosphotransferase [Bacteroidales bacterium]
MRDNIIRALKKLYFHYFGEKPDYIDLLPYGGSNRNYYRVVSQRFSAIGVYNSDKEENETFLYMTNFFLAENIPVPVVYLTNLDENVMLLKDLGDQTLFSVITGMDDVHDKEELLKSMFKKVVSELARIQVVAGKKFDFSKCYAGSEFDKSAVFFDLEYFRREFLDQVKLNYPKIELKKDFQKLADFVDSADKIFFMYRDFQSRNIMIYQDKYYFIDYQGGRKGPMQYDLASLLFQARAGIPEKVREEILEYYVQIIRMFTPTLREEFLCHYYTIALVRVLQTLGAYGLRGLKEQKSHFIRSIPFALNNLNTLSEKVDMLSDLPHLDKVINILKHTKLNNYGIQQ